MPKGIVIDYNGGWRRTEEIMNSELRIMNEKTEAERERDADKLKMRKIRKLLRGLQSISNEINNN
jgi:hypothetical protein